MAFGGGTTWMLEIQRRTSSGRLVGIAPRRALTRPGQVWRRRVHGVALGSRSLRRSRPTIGAGIEVATTMVRNTYDHGLVDDRYQLDDRGSRTPCDPRLYLRGGLAGFVDVSDSLAIMARIGAHLSTLSDHTDANWLVGVRMKLP